MPQFIFNFIFFFREHKKIYNLYALLFVNYYNLCYCVNIINKTLKMLKKVFSFN